MKKLLLTFSVKDITDKAGDISSVLGASRASEEGVILFDALSLTGDDYLMVNTAVGEAATEINNKCMGYVFDMFLLRRTDSELIKRIDFEFELPYDAECSIIYPLNESILSFFVYYLIGYWLGIKKPDEAEFYRTKASDYLSKVFSLLHRRKRGVKRKYHLY